MESGRAVCPENRKASRATKRVDDAVRRPAVPMG